MTKRYFIEASDFTPDVNHENRVFWSNDWGWTDSFDEVTLFDEQERANMNLPLFDHSHTHVRWVEIK